MSAAEDVLQFAQATATKSLTGDISKTLEASLGRADLANSLAGKIDSAIKPISGALTGVITATLTGDADGLKNVAKDVLGSALSNGLTEGITSGVGSVKAAIGSLVQEGVVNPFKSLLGIHSPSTVFIGYGHNAAEGFTIGFAEGLNDGTFDTIIERFLGRIEGKLSATKKRSAENLAKLMQREPEFKPKLIEGSRQRGINPDHLLNLMAVETAGTFNPAIKNPNSSASGLIQFMAQTARELGTTTQALRKMTATQQLDYVFKYFDHYFKNKDLSTQGALYAAVGTGKVGTSDNSVVMTSRNAGYAGNAATWDPNRDGVIRQGEMALAPLAKLGAGVNFTVNGSHAVTSSNPMPVMIVAGKNGPQIGVDVGGYPFRTPQVGVDVGGEAFRKGPTVIAGELTAAEMQKVLTMVNRMRDTNAQALTTTNVMATSIMPRATQALGQMADNTERIVKGAGDWKDVIVESEEAVKRLKVHWNGIASSFEDAVLTATGDALRGKFGDALKGFFLNFSFDIAQQFNSAFTSRLSKSLFDFQGSDSEATGGLVGKLLNKIGLGSILEKAGLQSKKAAAPSSGLASGAGSAISAQTTLNSAMQTLVEMNRHRTRPRRAGSMPESATGPNVGADIGIGAGVLRQQVQTSTDKLISNQQAQTAQLTTAMASNTDRIVDAVTPRKEGFWKGFFRTALSAAGGAAVGAAVGDIFGGDNVQRPDEGPRQPRPTTPPVMKFPNGRRATGGIIHGPGTETSDSILGIDRNTGQPTAWVSRNEFVVNAAATRKNRATLEVINKTGKLPGLAWGGFLKPTNPTSDQASNVVYLSDASSNRRPTSSNNQGSRSSSSMAQPSGEVHKHYHFNVHAHGSDAAQSIHKSKRQMARQARDFFAAA